MRSSPHDGTGDCSIVALTGVSTVVLIPLVFERVFAKEAGTTYVVDEPSFPITVGAVPRDAVMSLPTSVARAADTSRMT